MEKNDVRPTVQRLDPFYYLDLCGTASFFFLSSLTIRVMFPFLRFVLSLMLLFNFL